MRYALLLNNVVEEIVDEKYPVNEKLIWVEFDQAETIGVGYSFNGECFTPPVPKEKPEPEPDPAPDLKSLYILIDAIAKFCLGIIDKAALQKVYDGIKVI